jgi:Ca-activated chloride channel homolog
MGAPALIMTFNRIMNFVLTISLVIGFGGICLNNLNKSFLLSPAIAQDESGGKKPRTNRPRTPPRGEEDQENPQGRTAISVAVDLVTIQVLVTDQKGGVVTGLGPQNFTIYEDNVKQEITSFAPVEATIQVVMLVEYSRQIYYFIEDIWSAMSQFVSSLRKGDWAAVIGYDMTPRILCDFTQDRQKLLNTMSYISMPAMSESNLSDALIDALNRTQELEGKAAILLISTGLDTFSRHTYDDALKKCKEASASVYTIGLGQQVRIRGEAVGAISPEFSAELLMADTRLRSFAEFTGGAAYFPRFDTELPAIFANISKMLRSQYNIAYVSSNTNKDGKFRKIRVDINSDLMENGKPVKLKVQTRKGYIAKQN